MKQLTLIALIWIITCNAFAQSKNSPTLPNKEQATQPDKVEVATPNLPEPVKNIITTTYNEWKLMSVYVYNDMPDYYELTLKKGNEEKIMTVDAKGNEVKK